jgi:Icc-related predicted phosphoesterase
MSQKPFKGYLRHRPRHGSKICWRKSLNAGTFYQADVVIVDGDITGQAMVPIIRRRTSGTPLTSTSMSC